MYDTDLRAQKSRREQTWRVQDARERQRLGGQLHSARDALRYMLAGDARFALKSRKSGDHYTYSIRADDARDDLKFVYAATGEGDKFLGCLWDDEKFVQSQGSKFEHDDDRAVAFRWFWRQASDGNLPDNCEFWHANQCGRCGRTLTDPESVDRGIGPICAEKLADENEMEAADG